MQRRHGKGIMTWDLFIQIVIATATVAGLIGAFFGWLRKIDKDEFKGSISDLKQRIQEMYTTMQAKIDREEHRRDMEKVVKDIDGMRADHKDSFNKLDSEQKAGFDKLDAKLDRIIESITNKR